MVRPRVAVAVSGGRDSTALLHCTLRLARPLNVEVVALHVHHGLMPQADGWLKRVQRQSQRWGARFLACRLETTPGPGESIEAWARRERYAALARMAREADCNVVLLAHHRRDQAETWVLQALRGAGPAGLSAMPAVAQRAALTWARPWLDQPREAIERYVRRHRLRHVDDSSNNDARFARNRLRLQVWPALLQAFPDAEVTLAGAARRAQEAASLAAEIAQHDLPPLLLAGALRVVPWLALPAARRRNALRSWLIAALPAGAPQTLLHRLVDELPGRSAARWPVPGGTLRLHRGLLHLTADAAPTPAMPCGLANLVDLSQPGRYTLPGAPGHFDVETTAEGGVLAHQLLAVRVQPRQGGERFSLTANGLPRSLKKQFQALVVPAWLRDGPLLFTAQGQLLWVPALGIDARFQAARGTPQLRVTWQPGSLPPPGSCQPAG